MQPIETIARPRRNRISVAVPKEYASYSFQVILVPLADETPSPAASAAQTVPGGGSFVDALLSCPKLADGETLDVSRDSTDFGREVALEWGRICGEAERAGRKRPAVDALIAATASVHNLRVVTRNVDDMAGMGVPLFNPFSET